MYTGKLGAAPVCLSVGRGIYSSQGRRIGQGGKEQHCNTLRPWVAPCSIHSTVLHLFIQQLFIKHLLCARELFQVPQEYTGTKGKIPAFLECRF